MSNKNRIQRQDNQLRANFAKVDGFCKNRLFMRKNYYFWAKF